MWISAINHPNGQLLVLFNGYSSYLCFAPSLRYVYSLWEFFQEMDWFLVRSYKGDIREDPAFKEEYLLDLALLVALGFCFLCPTSLESWKIEVTIYLRQKSRGKSQLRKKVSTIPQSFLGDWKRLTFLLFSWKEYSLLVN